MHEMESSRFLDFYNIDGKFLIESDPITGQPNLVKAEKDGCPLLIKFWPRNASIDNDLESIWLHELRQLHRLKGYPGVGDYVSTIVESGRDESGFYLVLDASGRVPLSCLVKSTGTLTLQTHWLKRMKGNPKNRVLFWKNVTRIVRAIELLHTQGLLHRHLDINSILSSADFSKQSIDFQLTGFEWSVRVHTMSSAPVREEKQLSLGDFCSFATDWHDLGILLIDLLGADIETLKNLRSTPDLISEKTGLTLSEAHLIRALIGVVPIRANTPHEVLNSELIERSIEKIVLILESLILATSRSYRISLNIKFGMPPVAGLLSLKSAIQIKYKEIYGVTISDADIEEMHKFVLQDLSDSPTAIFPLSPDGAGSKLFLKGKELLYEFVVVNKNRTKN